MGVGQKAKGGLHEALRSARFRVRLIALISPTPRAVTIFAIRQSGANRHFFAAQKSPPQPQDHPRASAPPPATLVKCRFDTPFGATGRTRFDTSEALLNDRVSIRPSGYGSDRWSLSEVEVPVAE